MERTAKILVRVKDHLDYAVAQGYKNWVFIALAGSQNYNLDTEESDVDTKLFIYPTIEEMATLTTPVSRTLDLPNGEKCEVKDIRLLPILVRKQNINFLEVLFTNFYIVKPSFLPFIEKLKDRREDIAHYDSHAMFMSMRGQIHTNYRKFIEQSEPKYYIKNFILIARVVEFLKSYFVYANSFEASLTPFSYESLITMKQSPSLYDKKFLLKKVNILLEELEILEELFLLPVDSLKCLSQKEIDVFLSTLMTDLIRFTY